MPCFMPVPIFRDISKITIFILFLAASYAVQCNLIGCLSQKSDYSIGNGQKVLENGVCFRCPSLPHKWEEKHILGSEEKS